MNTSIPRVGFVSLGCPKATVDSEQVITQLRAEGYDIVPDLDDANEIWRRLGFTVTPRGKHIGRKTGNRCIMFRQDYLEPTLYKNLLQNILRYSFPKTQLYLLLG